MTLVELLIALGVLVVTGIGGYSGFLLLNRYASNLRNTTYARELCQERIEQGLSLPFRPVGVSTAFPQAPSAVPVPTGSPTPPPLAILGTASNYSNGAFTGANVQTSSETIPVLMQSENNMTTGGANVTYTRTTTVSAAGLNQVLSDGTVSANSLNMVTMTVAVSWVYRGSTYTTSMTTLRSQDH